MAWLQGRDVDEAFNQRVVKFVNAKYRHNGELDAEDLAQEILCALFKRAEFLEKAADEEPAAPDGPRDLWVRIRASGKLVPCSWNKLLWRQMLNVLRKYSNRRKSFQRYATARYGSAVRNGADDDQGTNEVALVESAAETAARNERHELSQHALARIESAHPFAVAFARAKDDGVTIEELLAQPGLGSRALSAGYRALNRLKSDNRFVKERALATA